MDERCKFERTFLLARVALNENRFNVLTHRRRHVNRKIVTVSNSLGRGELTIKLIVDKIELFSNRN